MAPGNPPKDYEVDWSVLELATGQTAVSELEGTPLYAAAVALAKQNADPKEAERRYLKDFPTRTAHARLFALAVRYLQVAGVA